MLTPSIKTNKHSAEFVQVNTRNPRTSYPLLQASCATNDVTCAQALRKFIRNYRAQHAYDAEVSQ